MLTLHVWAPVFAGVVFLFVALFYWVLGQRRRSLGLRWISLVNVAFALWAFISAGAQLANTYGSDLWWALTLATLFLAGCALVIAVVYFVRESQRGSGMQRYHS
jgi:hypothetical protein